MKKFFALFLVVALLALAGSAFAAPDDVSHGSPQNPPTPSTTEKSTGGSSAATRNIITSTIQTKVVAKAITIVVPVINVTRSVADTLASITLSSGKTAAAIQQAVETAVNAIVSSFSSFSGAAVKASTLLSSEGVTSRVPETATQAEKLTAATQSIPKELRATEIPAAVIPAFSPKEDGVYTIAVPVFARSFYGMPLNWHASPRGKTTSLTSASFYATAAEEGAAVFLNSNGDSVDVVPSGDKEGVEPGFVSVVTYLKGGEEYDPVLTVPTASVDANPDIKTEETTVTAEVTEYVAAMSTTEGASSYVPAAVLTVMGTGYKMLDDANFATTAWDAATVKQTLGTAKVDSSGDSYDKVSLASIPKLQNIPAGNYAIQIKLDGNTGNKPLHGDKVFYFYATEADVTSDTSHTVKLVKYIDGTPTVVTPETAGVKAGDGYSYEGDVYLGFTVEGDAIVNAANTGELTPILAVERTTAKYVAPQDTTDEPPIKTTGDGTGPGDSSGGCSTGFTALALAVLGSFIATRKK